MPFIAMKIHRRLFLCAAAAAALPSLLPAQPASDAGAQKTLYVVGYAHLDTQWRWTYPQVIDEFLADTLHNNFELFSKYPDYIFNFTGSRRYELMQEYYPADFETLKRYVALGRWFPAGSSVDEGDSIVPSGESMIRHVLYGNHYFRRTFGVASGEFMLPDCFGFPAALPSLLAHCGILGFSTQKLTWGSANGIPFKVGVWVGPDGKSVVAALDPGSYSAKLAEDLSWSNAWLERIEHTGSLSGAYVDYHYVGTGDRGGSPPESSVRWMETSIHGNGPVKVVSADADRMFREITPAEKARLPHYTGELLLTNHSAGSISSEAYMKRWNRKNELLADAAERASVAADWLGAAPYQAERLYRGWDLVLGSQMHDMLPGTSLPLAYQYCWNDECLAQNQFAGVLQDSLGGVCTALDTRAQGVPLVVYNPLSIDREDVVQAQVRFPGPAPAAVRVIGPSGEEAPSQVIGRSGPTATILILARAPSVGFAVYDVRPAAKAPETPPELSATATGLENARYRVRIAADGDIASIFDKALGRELLSAPMRLAFQFEKPADYPAWNMDWDDQRKPPRDFVDGPASIRVGESGPVRVAVEIAREAEGSRFVQTVRLAAGGAGDRVEISARIDWQSRECALKQVFPLTASNPLATYDGQIGTLVRGNDEPRRFEVPQHQWFDLTDASGRYGAAVLNDCKYGSDKPDDHTMRLTLLYTPGVRERYQDQASQDEGRHRMLYAVMGHAGGWSQGNVPWTAARLNQPLVAAQAPSHPGPLGKSLSLLRVNSPQVAVMALKKAEDGDAFVLRLNELDGRPARGVQIAFAAPIVSAREVDGQERDAGPAPIDGGILHTELPTYGLRAFALRLERPKGASGPAAGGETEALPLPVNFIAATAPGAPSPREGGGLNATGLAYPAEALPREIACDGVRFQLASAGGTPDAVACEGQRIALPAGYRRVYLLAAADGGEGPRPGEGADVTGVFRFGSSTTSLRIQNWTGFIGQWDTRLWRDPQPELGYVWTDTLAGLSPGYLKEAEVAWYSSHRHDASGANQAYRYSYLFKYGIAIPPGATSLALPDEPRIKVFALTVARGEHDQATLCSPVYERFLDHTSTSPSFLPAAGRFDDAQEVEIVHPLYWREGRLHYTLDGSEPTGRSPVFSGEKLLVVRPTVIKARYLDAGGEGPEATARFDVDDRTPPRVVGVYATTTSPRVVVTFSEPVERASAESLEHYRLGSGDRPLSATLGHDRRTATLVFPIGRIGGRSTLLLHGIADVSPAANALPETTVPLVLAEPLLVVPAARCPEDARELPLPALGRAWSMNCFVKAGSQPANRTLIAGFGSLADENTGEGRYLGKFSDGIHFWSHKFEIGADDPIAAGSWQMLTVTYDGRNVTLYVNGAKTGDGARDFGPDEPVLRLAPLDPWDHMRRFQGELRDLTVWPQALPPETVGLLWNAGKQAP